MREDWLGGGTITMKLQKVNPNELVIFSMVWRKINRVMESTSLRKRQSIKICTDKTHNRRTVTLKMSKIKVNSRLISKHIVILDFENNNCGA